MHVMNLQCTDFGFTLLSVNIPPHVTQLPIDWCWVIATTLSSLLATLLVQILVVSVYQEWCSQIAVHGVSLLVKITSSTGIGL